MDLKKDLQEDYNMNTYHHYLIFADLFRYPDELFPELVGRCIAMLREKYPDVVHEMEVFQEYVNTHTRDEREELFTKTFDVQPICYLDLGYVIWGEDYKRGAFLLHMQQEQEAAGNDCGTELPDNISNMLTLFTKTENQVLLDELAVKILIPGVKKMIAEFEQAKVDLKIKVLRKLHNAIIQEELNSGNVYRRVFETLLHILKKDFEHVHFQEAEDTIINKQHHQSFFGKHSVNIEVNNIVNNYKLD